MTTEWDLPDPFFIEMTVEPSEIDTPAVQRLIDDNAVYLSWLERCAWAHSDAVGIPETRCQALRRGMAVRSVRLDYLGGCYEGDTIRVANWVIANDQRLRATRRFQVVNETRDRVVLRGEIDYFCMNLDSGRPAKMPSEFVSAYGAVSHA